MGGVVHGMVIVERVAWFGERNGWRKQDIGTRVGQVVGSGGGEGALR